MKNTLTKDTPWFCFDGDNYEYFATEEEAVTASETAIQYYLDESWDECVENVLVGKITRKSTQTNVVQRPDEIDEEDCDGQGEYWPSNCEYKCDYEALPL